MKAHFKCFYVVAGGGYFYFRLFGWGLHFKDWRKNPLLFSEREYVKVGKPILIIAYWRIKILRPSI